MKQRITVKTIAEKAGVNQATVSRALNQATAYMISEKMREKIRKICDELDYRPNYSGRSIVTGKTFKIGMILCDMLHDFSAHDWARIIYNLSIELQKHGYALTILHADGNENCDRQVLDFLMSGIADGYVTSPSMLGTNVFNMLQKLKAPLWIVCPSGETVSAINHIQRDDIPAFSEVWHNIPENILDKTAFFGAESIDVNIRLREIKAASVIAHPGKNIIITPIFYKHHTRMTALEYRDSYRQAIIHMDELKKHKFIWCDSDLSARALCDALEDNGIMPGKDIYIIGYGDFETYEKTDPHPVISTISANADFIGETIGKLLMSAKNNNIQRKIIQSTFIPRETFPVNK